MGWLPAEVTRTASSWELLPPLHCDLSSWAPALKQQWFGLLFSLSFQINLVPATFLVEPWPQKQPLSWQGELLGGNPVAAPS